MSLKLSKFATSLTGDSGTTSLMQDLGEALAADRNYLMLGGGNPGSIPPVQSALREELAKLANDPERFNAMVGPYDSPQGDHQFLSAIASLLRDECGWDVGPENCMLTNGSQAGFFLLFNALAGEFDDGSRKLIELPLTPEYLGYADVGLDNSPLFRSRRPKIETVDSHTIKYRVDFDNMTLGEDSAAICVSRPTNPTGNMISDDEVRELQRIARAGGVPLIIDGAYGQPFPGIVFNDATALFDDNTIVFLSLSKLGLAGIRTGIIVGPAELIAGLSSMNAITNLAPGSAGPGLMLDLVRSRKILNLSREHVQPYYRDRADFAVDVLANAMGDTPWKIHQPEGAFFLWTTFPDIPLHSQKLYERIKDRGALVIAGHHFFAGLEHDPWQHKTECLRITYAQDKDDVRKGIEIVADEVKRAYDGA